MKKKSQPFSIYLLKSGYNATNSLRLDHNLTSTIAAKALPEGASLCVLDAMPTQPWWRAYFEIEAKLPQNRKGALVFLPVEDKWFALTFGSVYHNLIDEAIEHDFGLRVTLNCVDPRELKSTDTLEPGEARRQRTQMPTGADLTYFDFDRDSSVIKSITGKVAKEYAKLFGQVTGASSLSISSDVEATALPAFCKQLLDLYASEQYKTNFPGLQSIAPVKDSDLISALDVALVNAIRNGDDALFLVLPEIVDYGSGLHYAAFTGEGASLVYSEVYLANYLDYLSQHGKQRQDLALADLKRHGLDLCNSEGLKAKHYNIYRSIIFDTTLQDSSHTFHLMEGKWYKVENSYIERLREKLNPLCVDLPLPDFAEKSEGEYNELVANQHDGYICLDERDISPAGQSQIEPSDLYAVEDGFAVLYHVKRSTLSAQLSHLFNQGVNALELLKLEPESLGKLKSLIADIAGQGNPSFPEAPVDNKRFRIVFVIITHKDKARKSDNLPLFSRVSLFRILRAIELMSADCRYGFVGVALQEEAPKPKPRKKKKTAEAVASEESLASAS